MAAPDPVLIIIDNINKCAQIGSAPPEDIVLTWGLTLVMPSREKSCATAYGRVTASPRTNLGD